MRVRGDLGYHFELIVKLQDFSGAGNVLNRVRTGKLLGPEFPAEEELAEELHRLVTRGDEGSELVLGDSE